jgi:hypothetical protein
MQGILHLAFYEYGDAYAFLSTAYDKGCESVFMYFALYHYYRTSVHAPSGPTLLPVLRWAAARRVDVADIVGVYQDEIRAAIIRDPAAGERIYESVPHPFILREICACRMMAKDYGPEAYAYYRAAENRQIYLTGLYEFLVRAAYKKRAEHINHYAMTEFLRSGSMDTDLSIYVYHLLLSDPALADLLPERKNNILKMAAHCLEHNHTGREANSLYYYYWTQCREMGIGGELVEKAERLLYEDLTRFEILTSPDVRFIYVAEPEKKGTAILETEEYYDGRRAETDAVSAKMSLTCLGAGKRNVIDDDVTVRRKITRAEPALYRYFFGKGARSFFLLAYLTNYYMDRLAEYGGGSLTTGFFNEAVNVLTAALEEKAFVKAYRMRILVSLGRLHYGEGKFAQALGYYANLEEQELDDAHIEQILQVFLQTHEWARAAELIKRRWRNVNPESLADALIKLAAPDMAVHHKSLAEPAYDLLVTGYYDAGLLDIVLTHFPASQSELQELARAVSQHGASSTRLDEMIVNGSLTTGSYDIDSQKAFARLCKGIDVSRLPFDSPTLLPRFVEFSAYEMVVNHVKPEYEALVLLEDAYLKGSPQNNMLAYGLCHVYLKHSVTTFNSEKIIASAMSLQQDAGMLFPVFRDNRSKQPGSLYTEKYQPFMYKGLPDKDVWLYYRIDESGTWHSKRMEYLSFGLYLTKLPMFYNEQLTYYFSEEMATGSITTREAAIKNESVYIDEKAGDDFFTINSAVAYEQMFRYDLVEKIITELLTDLPQVRGGLM